MDTFCSDSIGYCQSTILNEINVLFKNPLQSIGLIFIVFTEIGVEVPYKLDFTVFLVILSNKIKLQMKTPPDFPYNLSDLRHSYYLQKYCLPIFVDFKSYFKNTQGI